MQIWSHVTRDLFSEFHDSLRSTKRLFRYQSHVSLFCNNKPESILGLFYSNLRITASHTGVGEPNPWLFYKRIPQKSGTQTEYFTARLLNTWTWSRVLTVSTRWSFRQVKRKKKNISTYRYSLYIVRKRAEKEQDEHDSYFMSATLAACWATDPLQDLKPIQTGLFGVSWDRGLGGGGGGLRRPYTCNSITAYDMATKFKQDDVLIDSII